MGRQAQGGPDVDSALVRVDRLFGSSTRRRRRDRGFDAGAVRDLQVGALHHPDPYIRRSCLWALDHDANDVSMPVFMRAIEDDVDFVRDVALHSLACEGCKEGEMCVADVVPPLVRVLEADPKPDLRIKALTALFRLSQRDDRVQQAFEQAARDNSDPVVRRCAAEAARGVLVMPKKRTERRQQRHAALGHGSTQPQP